jgi:hypothetical protein
MQYMQVRVSSKRLCILRIYLKYAECMHACSLCIYVRVMNDTYTILSLSFFRFLFFFFLYKDQCLPKQRMALVTECDPLPPAKRLSLPRPSSVDESGTRLITVLYQPNGHTSRADDQTSFGAPVSVVFQPFFNGPDFSKEFLPEEFVHKFVQIADYAYLYLLLSTGLDMVVNRIQTVSFLAGPEIWFTSASLFSLIHYIIDSSAGALQRLLLQRIRCVPVFHIDELFRFLQFIADNMMQLNELHIDISIGLRQDDSDAALSKFSSAVVSGVPERKAQPSRQFQKLTQFSFGSANATGRINYGPCTSVVAEKLSSLLPSGLKELHLYEPLFSEADIPALSSLLDGLKELTSLSCTLADLTKTADAERLTTSLSTLSKLRSLALEYVCGTVRKQKMPWVGGIQTLEKFTLRVVGNFCWGDFWKVVHDVLKRCRSLRELHVEEKTALVESTVPVSLCVVKFEEMERALANASELLEVLVWRVQGRIVRKFDTDDAAMQAFCNFLVKRYNHRVEYFPSVLRHLKLDNLVCLEIQEQRFGNWMHSNGHPSFRCLRSLKSLSLVNCQGCADSVLEAISELPLSVIESLKILDFEHISEPSGLDVSVATSTPATRICSLFHWLSHMKNLVVLHLSGGVGYSDLAYACKEMCVEDNRKGKVR